MESAPPSTFLESRESFLEGWREVEEVCSFVLCFLEMFFSLRWIDNKGKGEE